MRESTTYQGILDEGRLDEARKLLLRVGQKWLGAPDPSVLAVLAAVAKLERLERLHERLVEVKTWQELLAAD